MNFSSDIETKEIVSIIKKLSRRIEILEHRLAELETGMTKHLLDHMLENTKENTNDQL